MIIYSIKYKNNIVYVGQTTKSISDRFRSHLYRCKTKCSYKLYNMMRKYGPENFSIHLLEECNTPDELDNREIFWISKLNLIKEGCNHAVGGRVNRGMIRSDATREKIRKISKKRYHDDSPLMKWNGSQKQKILLKEKLSNVPKTTSHSYKAAKSRAKNWYLIKLADETEVISWSMTWISDMLDIPLSSLKYCRKTGKTLKGISVKVYKPC